MYDDNAGSDGGVEIGEGIKEDSKAQSTCEYALCPHVMNV